MREGSVGTTKTALTQLYGRLKRCRIALEAGTHSHWISRLLNDLGHEAIIANPRQLKLITESSRKNDRADAEMLARLARAHPKLRRPIRHHGEEAQMALMTIRVRAALVEAGTSLVSAVRGFSKTVSAALRKAACSQQHTSDFVR